ncbi:hypothetical protein [Rhizobium phage RHph_X3_2]|nr:hypothetical protein [Rhizobium phage RHph_X3_2]
MSKKIENLITAWNHASTECAKWTTEEMRLRKELAALLFPNPVEGSNNKTRVGHGKAIQMTHKINRSVDKKVLDELREKPNIAPLIADVIKYTPELKTKEFKALSADDVKLLAPAITEKPGAPTLELKDENKIRW